MKYKISPSLMCFDLLNIESQMNILNKYVYSYHLDFIDGIYFKNFCITPPFIKAMRAKTDAKLDVHMMIVDPFYYMKELVDIGVDCISFHSEKLINEAYRTANYLHSNDVEFGVVIAPETTVESIIPYIDQVDKITVMTEEPGFGGGEYIPNAIKTIRRLCEIRDEYFLDFKIEVDGVVNKEHFKEYKDAGVDIYILGSRGLFNLDKDLDKAVNLAIKNIEEA